MIPIHPLHAGSFLAGFAVSSDCACLLHGLEQPHLAMRERDFDALLAEAV